MIRTIALTVALAGCGASHAWRASDVALEATFAGELAVDWAQSRRFSRACEELNPVVGRCGQRVPLDVYIPVSALLHAVATYLLPAGTIRTTWLGITVGAEADAIYSNTLVKTGP